MENWVISCHSSTEGLHSYYDLSKSNNGLLHSTGAKNGVSAFKSVKEAIEYWKDYRLPLKIRWRLSYLWKK